MSESDEIASNASDAVASDPKKVAAAKAYIQKLVFESQLKTIKFDTSRNKRYKSSVYQNFCSVILNCEKNEFDSKGFQFTINTFLDELDQPYYELDGYLACKSCLVIYVSGSHGTSTLLKHNCLKKSSSNQSLITTHLTRKRTSQLPSKIVEKIREVETKFIVEGLRPFSITENALFRQLIETISDASATYGRLDATSILHSTKSLAKDIGERADVVRTDLKQKLEGVVGKTVILLCF